MTTLIDPEGNKKDLDTIKNQMEKSKKKLDVKKAFLDQDKLSMKNKREKMEGLKRKIASKEENESYAEMCQLLTQLQHNYIDLQDRHYKLNVE